MEAQLDEGVVETLPPMEKRRIRLADGRSLIFYTFPPDRPGTAPESGAAPSPVARDV